MATVLTKVAATAVFLTAIPASSAVLFADTNMNPADYTSTTFTSAGLTVSFAQTLSAGNPGSAFITTVEAPLGSYQNTNFHINRNFEYDISSSGPIGSIAWGIDAYVSSVNPAFTLSNNSVELILLQDGKYYFSSAPLPLVLGAFNRGSANGLTAGNFSLITDALSFAVDYTSHPNFNAGVIRFGFDSGVVGNHEGTITEKFDNLMISISPVPELPSTMLLFTGLILLAAVRSKQA